jgi:polyribonucleotide 5'-hydroxyl-kinase
MCSAGAMSMADPLRISPVAVGMDLLHTLLAVSHAADDSQLVSSNVAGFLYVKDVELVEQTLVCLAPAAGNLPSRMLLAGSFKVYFD